MAPDPAGVHCGLHLPLALRGKLATPRHERAQFHPIGELFVGADLPEGAVAA